MSQRFEIGDASLEGMKVLRRTVFQDERGSLERLYAAGDLRDVTGGKPVVQINLTRTRTRGTVRGMHYQIPPHAELKLITCVRGSVFDVVVDLRAGSPTLLAWHGQILSETDPTTLLVPEGFAHGFQALSDDCELLYLHTANYEPSAEGGLNPRDPLVGISWPEPISVLSERDAAHPLLSVGYAGIVL